MKPKNEHVFEVIEDNMIYLRGELERYETALKEMTADRNEWRVIANEWEKANMILRNKLSDLEKGI